EDNLKRWIRRVEAEHYYMGEYMRETYADINWDSPKQVAEVLKQHGVEVLDDAGKVTTDSAALQPYLDVEVVRDLLEYKTMSKITSTYGRRWLHYIRDNGRIYTRYKQLVETGRTSSGDTGGNPMYDGFENYECPKPFPNLQNPIRDPEFR